jgi:hypothetical protein
MNKSGWGDENMPGTRKESDINMLSYCEKRILRWYLNMKLPLKKG